MRIVFVADFFVEQILGGGELNSEELIFMLQADGHEVLKYNSHEVTVETISEHKNDNFIIANFCNLKNEVIASLYDKRYVIYEHDHKYLKTRNPGVFKGFKAPKTELVNIQFYTNAIAVLCQSNFHLEIVKLNTGLNNLINLSGNIWSVDSLKFMRQQSAVEKFDKHAIMESNIEHKNTADAIKYCRAKSIPYVLVSSNSYEKFLQSLGKNKTFIFLPKTPETLSRVIVEARMMNMGVVSNKLIGATKEPWYQLKGESLIQVMMQKRCEIKNKVVELFK